VEPPAGPVRLVVTASDTLTAPNSRLTFAAQAEDREGRVVATEAVAWSVSDTLRGRIGPDGAFVGGPWVGRLHVRATLATPELADSVAVRIVPPGTVKWTWAATQVWGSLQHLGGPSLGRDGTVYVLLATGTTPDRPAVLAALAPDGAVRWTRDLPQVYDSYVVVTPVEERLWVADRRLHLVGLDGSLLWDSLTEARSSGLKGGAASTDYLVSAHGVRLAVFRAGDRALVWQAREAPFSDWLVPPTLTAQDQVLAKLTDDTLFVFGAADGQRHRFFVDPDTGLDKRVFGRGTVPVGDRYYLPTQGRLASYDSAGPLRWLTEDTGNGMTEPAVGPDGSLYVQNRRHGLWALTAEGTERWKRFDVQPRWPALGGVALAAGGILYAAGIDAFWAVDTAGRTLWKHVVDSAGAPQPFTGAPAIAPDGTIYTWTSTHLCAFWGSAPPEPDSPWPMWRHDAQRTGWAGYRSN
jgi:outer membrane protein assembly factor BamB